MLSDERAVHEKILEMMKFFEFSLKEDTQVSGAVGDYKDSLLFCRYHFACKQNQEPQSLLLFELAKRMERKEVRL